MRGRLEGIRHVVLDMDGTIFVGDTLLEETRPFLEGLAQLGIDYSFITNNNSRSREEHVEHLAAMGLEESAERIFTSTGATVEYLRRHVSGVRRLLVLGTAGLRRELGRVFEIVEDRPDAVIVGFDTTLRYESLSRTAYWISQGRPYIATHPDRVCPTDRPIVLPDCGAICALLEAATGRKPDAIPGKPHPAMLRALMQGHGLSCAEVIMVGDRLYTDMRMALEAGVTAVLTLTGETTASMAASASPPPDVVIEDLGELGRLLEQARS